MPEAASPATAEQAKHPQHAHWVGLLTFASGGVDVVTLMMIGGAFTSVITGNLIFVGRAIGTTSLTPAVHAVLAVAGYIAGVAAGSRLRVLFGRDRPALLQPWPPSATQVLAAECALLAALNVAWIGYGAAPPAFATDLMLTAAAIALGMQGAAARGIEGNPSTTYMTGALTALVEALSTGRHRSADASAVVGLVALVAGAACGAVLIRHATRAALLPPLAALLLVVAVKLWQHRREARA
ncbi:MAG TPA: YoaK family protein [Trebonia sp.]|nr:YoaK family protein [Trebonia sp.]